MTQPINSQYEGDDRVYVWPPTKEKFYSVTTILNSLNKPALMHWSAKQAAQYVAGNFNEVYKMLGEDREAAIKHIAAAHTRTKDLSSDIGTHVHECVEKYIKGQDMPNPIPEHMRQFDKFLLEHNPKFEMCEGTVYNRQVGYAGSFDFIATIDGVRTIIDIKTGKNIYPEVALQLTAYKNGEFIGHDDKELPVPAIEAGGVLQLRMTGWKYIPVRVDSEVYLAFRHIHQAFMWQKFLSKNVLNGAV